MESPKYQESARYGANTAASSPPKRPAANHIRPSRLLFLSLFFPFRRRFFSSSLLLPPPSPFAILISSLPSPRSLLRPPFFPPLLSLSLSSSLPPFSSLFFPLVPLSLPSFFPPSLLHSSTLSHPRSPKNPSDCLFLSPSSSANRSWFPLPRPLDYRLSSPHSRHLSLRPSSPCFLLIWRPFETTTRLIPDASLSV